MKISLPNFLDSVKAVNGLPFEDNQSACTVHFVLHVGNNANKANALEM